MDFLFEIVLQFVVEVLGELLLEGGFRASAQALRSRIGRAVVSALAGFGFGVWWGAHLAEQGAANRPRLLWITLALAAAAAAAAAWRRRRSRDVTLEPWRVLAAPWRWDAGRLATFAVLNAAIAAGILTGWHPPALR